MKLIGIEFNRDLRELSTKDLAYIGDAVFELYCRLFFNFDNNSVREHVNAKAQAEIFDKIKNLLSEEEKEIALRGRNLKSPRSKEPSYRKATALESIVGYLFLQGKEERLEELLTCIFK